MPVSLEEQDLNDDELVDAESEALDPPSRSTIARMVTEIRRRRAASFGWDIESPGVAELRAAFDALDRPAETPQVLSLLFRAVREVLGADRPRAIWGPGAPELRLAVERLLRQRGGMAALAVSDRWGELIRAARVVAGNGQLWQLGDP